MSKVWTIARREPRVRSGIEGQSFAGTEPKGVEGWLDQLAKEPKDLLAAIGTEGSNLNQMAR
jgi:hypothetical protein